MNMQDSDKILQMYIEQILKLQDEKNQEPLRVEELNKLALNLGLTEEDLQFIYEKFTASLQRGLGYSRYKNWDKAIEELEQAVVLKPLHVEALFGLADAYRHRWLAKGKKTDKENALKYAERCLQSHYTHEGSLHLISQLNNTKPQKRIGNSYKRLFLMVGSATIFSLLTWMALLLWNPFVKPEELKKDESKTIVISKTKKQNIEIPINLKNDTKSEGLRLDLESSFLEKESGVYTYHLRGSLLTRLFEIDLLKLKLDLTDETGKIAYSETIDFLDKSQPEMRTGDSKALSKLIKNEKLNISLKKARLSIVEISRIKTEEYEAGKEIETLWEIPKPKDCEIILRERTQTLVPEADYFRQNLVLEFENRSKNFSIKNLEIKIQWFNLEEKLIHEELLTLLNQETSLLKPKERRTAQAEFEIRIKKSDYLNYKIVILRAE